MTIFSWTFPGGKLLDKIVVKGTAAGGGKGNFSEDETEHRITVPAGKRWLLFSAFALIDANATLSVKVYNSSDQCIATIGASGATTGMLSFPDAGADGELRSGVYPLPLKAGDYIATVFGANQAATAYVGAVILEIDV